MIMKWMWMMNYCKKNNLPPAHGWAWDRARIAYEALKLEDLDHIRAHCDV